MKIKSQGLLPGLCPFLVLFSCLYVYLELYLTLILDCFLKPRDYLPVTMIFSVLRSPLSLLNTRRVNIPVGRPLTCRLLAL